MFRSSELVLVRILRFRTAILKTKSPLQGLFVYSDLVRIRRIELLFSRWQRGVLPLNYIRSTTSEKSPDVTQGIIQQEWGRAIVGLISNNSRPIEIQQDCEHLGNPRFSHSFLHGKTACFPDPFLVRVPAVAAHFYSLAPARTRT